MDKLLEEDLRNLRCQTESKDLRMAIETLITVHRNIKQNSTDPKYRRIKTSNQAFFNKIWKHVPAANFMCHSGWKPFSDDLTEIFYADCDSLDVTLQVLLKNRNITPCVDEWDDNTKFEGKSEKQLREEKLKKKAMEERDKELAAYLKDVEERKAVVEHIKAEHRADRERIKTLGITEHN